MFGVSLKILLKSDLVDNSELCELLWVSCLAQSSDSVSNHESTTGAQGRRGLGNGWQRFVEECEDDVCTSESDKCGFS